MHRTKPFLLSAILLGIAAASPAQTLSPPWYTLWNQIVRTIGDDPNITVDPLGGSNPYLITIHAPSTARAQAIATILPPLYSIGNITVNVTVLDPSGNTALPASPTTLDGVKNFLYSALATNRLFVGAGETQSRVAAVFTRQIVQFFNDDLSEAYQNYVATAAQAYAAVLKTKYGVVTLIFGTQAPGPVSTVIPLPEN
jgi:hypothetical protein